MVVPYDLSNFISWLGKEAIFVAALAELQQSQTIAQSKTLPSLAKVFLRKAPSPLVVQYQFRNVTLSELWGETPVIYYARARRVFALHTALIENLCRLPFVLGNNVWCCDLTSVTREIQVWHVKWELLALNVSMVGVPFNMLFLINLLWLFRLFLRLPETGKVYTKSIKLKVISGKSWILNLHN